MDRTLQQQAANVMALTAENGGGTFEGKTLLPFTPDSGFAVGIGGVAIKADCATVETVAILMRAVPGEYMTTYVGTWLQGDVLHIDAVRYFGADRYLAAIAEGEAAGQQAIYDFTDGKDITL